MTAVIHDTDLAILDDEQRSSLMSHGLQCRLKITWRHKN